MQHEDWKIWNTLEQPPRNGVWRSWAQWAVAQFIALERAPQPIEFEDVSEWRDKFAAWARTASATMREICLFLLRFSHPRGEFRTLVSPEYNLTMAVANMDDGNRRAMGRVIMYARIY